jgi:ABC-type dipeptide/oligopeptide/nickel transport system ATPase component
MEKIIGLYGKGNCGKSFTLKKLIQIFRESPNTHKEENIEDFGEDFRTTFTFKDKRVCIATGGDDNDYLKENCNYFKNNKFDIAISATRTSGETCDCLNNFAKKYNQQVTFYKKYIENLDDKKYQDALNELQAKELFDSIDSL